MFISNNQIFERLKELGWNSPTINENNRIYGLALIYNTEIEQSMDQQAMGTDNQQMEEEDALHKEQRCKINLTLFIMQTNDF
jgi:broad-specificity NMP kinase